MAAEKTVKAVPGEGHVEVAHGRQEDTAPVHDGALDEEGDAGDDADEGHDALRQREQLAAGIAAIGQQMARGRERHEHHDGGRDDGREQRRQRERADPDAEESGPREAADAPERVHAAHEAAPRCFLDDDGLDVDDDIDAAHRRAEDQQQRHGHAERRYRAEREQQDGVDEPRRCQHLAAAESDCRRTRHRHRQQ